MTTSATHLLLAKRLAPLALAAAALGAQAQPAGTIRPPEGSAARPGEGLALSFDAAWQRLQGNSDKLAAARNALESRQLQGQGLKGLGGPVLSLTGAAFAYNANLALNLDAVNQRLVQTNQRLPVPLENLPLPLPVPQLPSRYTFNRHDTGQTASLTAVWPIYLGGVSDAVRGFSGAQADGARAEADQAGHELATLLVQRYFGAQLAARAATLREAAFQGIEQHDTAAEKMLRAGVISRLERLQAQSALEDARRNALKARDDADLSAVALSRTLKAGDRVSPTSPLFVLSQPVEPLPHFVEAAQARHPGLARVAAKKAEAEQLHAGQEALRRPQVFAFGQRELKTGSAADWVAGVGVRWTLWDAVDRNALEAASLKQVAQAERTDAQARNDIALLVEKNWLTLEQARRGYFAMASSVALAEEVLRLRQAGLREGTSTTLELIDAQLNLAKVQTERAQAAHDYVVALAQLLESCGLSEEFGQYMARADVKVQ